MANEDRFIRDDVRDHIQIDNVQLVAFKGHDREPLSVKVFQSKSTTIDIRLTVESISAIMHCLPILSEMFAILFVDFKKKTNICSNISVDAGEETMNHQSIRAGYYESQFMVSNVKDYCEALSHESHDNIIALEKVWKTYVGCSSSLSRNTHARFVRLGKVDKQNSRKFVRGAVADTGGILVPDARNCHLKEKRIKLKVDALNLDDDDHDLGEDYSAKCFLLLTS